MNRAWLAALGIAPGWGAVRWVEPMRPIGAWPTCRGCTALRLVCEARERFEPTGSGLHSTGPAGHDAEATMFGSHRRFDFGERTCQHFKPEVDH